MSSTFCPRCQQKVDSQAVTCPYCRTELKAFGHPGITVHRALGDEYLCDSCTYHVDDSCTYPQRPLAKDCTLYDNWELRQQKRSRVEVQPSRNLNLRSFVNRYQGVLLIAGLLIICFIIVVSST